MWVRLIKSKENKIPAVEYRNMHDAIHHLSTFNNRKDAEECYDMLKDIENLEFENDNDYIVYLEMAFSKSIDDFEVDYRTIQQDLTYDIINKDNIIDIY